MVNCGFLLLLAVIFTRNVKMPERNWRLVKGRVLWHKSSWRLSSGSESSRFLRPPAQLFLPHSLLEVHVQLSLFITCWHLLPPLQKCACIGRAAAETPAVGVKAGICRRDGRDCLSVWTITGWPFVIIWIKQGEKNSRRSWLIASPPEAELF